MSDETAPLVVTLKAGTGYDAPWIVVRGDNPVDVTNKLNSLGDVIAATVTAAELFKGAGTAAPLTAPQAPQQAPVAPQAPSNGWGGQPQQQAAPPQQGGYQQPAQQPSRQGAMLHPEGERCHCGKTLEHAMTRTNKAQWKCPDYRWNNGNPNDHRLEWAN